jgi:hypothetical protein
VVQSSDGELVARNDKTTFRFRDGSDALVVNVDSGVQPKVKAKISAEPQTTVRHNALYVDQSCTTDFGGTDALVRINDVSSNNSNRPSLHCNSGLLITRDTDGNGRALQITPPGTIIPVLNNGY